MLGQLEHHHLWQGELRAGLSVAGDATLDHHLVAEDVAVEDEHRRGAGGHPYGLGLGRGGNPVHNPVHCIASERSDALTVGFSCRRDRFRTYDPYRVKVTMGVT